ncbi:MAG TPA: ribosome recycling factor [Kiloniellales bacterium]|nr:ribosome recycling factor [Kiloniellales bacterium]
MPDALIKELKRRMEGAQDALKREFGGLRTGRAATSLLDPIMVEAYGTPTPLNQVGTVGVPEPRMLTVQVWDRKLVSAVEKAIRESGLGLNPSNDGNLIRIPIPPLSEERRQELARVAARYAEQARVAVRNVRRDGMDQLKRMEKDNEISEDIQRRKGEEIQKLTDEQIKLIDDMLAQKESEIMQV